MPFFNPAVFARAKRFLFANFEETGVITNKAGILHMGQGTNLFGPFTERPVTYITSDTSVRDPEIIVDPNNTTVLWLFYTNRPFDQIITSFGIARSTDGGNTFIHFGNVDCSAVATGSARVWGPIPVLISGAIHIVVACSSNGDAGPFQLYETHPTDSTFAVWSTLVALTGTELVTSMIDGVVVPVPGGTYELWYKNETTKFIEVLTSSSPFSGYDTVKFAGDDIGWGDEIEASQVYPLGGSSWVSLADPYVALTGVAYSISTDNRNTWSALTTVSWDGSAVARNSSLSIFPAIRDPSLVELETSELLSYMDIQPNATRRGHINTLISSLKSSGVWGKLDVLYILAATDAQAAGLNWRHPSIYEITPVSSPTFTADRGYAGNGSSSYLNTGWSPRNNQDAYRLNAAHISAYDRTNRTSAATTAIIGTNTVAHGDGSQIFPLYQNGPTTDFFFEINSNGGAGATGDNLADTAQGYWIANRSAETALQLYRNGSSVDTDTTSTLTGGSSVQSLLIGCGRSGASAVPDFFSTDQIAAASAGGTLTAQNVTDLTTAIEVYMDAVGAGII